MCIWFHVVSFDFNGSTPTALDSRTPTTAEVARDRLELLAFDLGWPGSARTNLPKYAAQGAGCDFDCPLSGLTYCSRHSVKKVQRTIVTQREIRFLLAVGLWVTG